MIKLCIISGFEYRGAERRSIEKKGERLRDKEAQRDRERERGGGEGEGQRHRQS